jgi:hypothetical protein
MAHWVAVTRRAPRSARRWSPPASSSSTRTAGDPACASGNGLRSTANERWCAFGIATPSAFAALFLATGSRSRTAAQTRTRWGVAREPSVCVRLPDIGITQRSRLCPRPKCPKPISGAMRRRPQARAQHSGADGTAARSQSAMEPGLPISSASLRSSTTLRVGRPCKGGHTR